MLGSQLFGSYLRLYPNLYKGEHIISIDYFSLIIVVICLSFLFFQDFSLFEVGLVIVALFFFGFYEYFSVYFTINNMNAQLGLTELLNTISLLSLLCLVNFGIDSKISAYLSYGVIFLVFLFLALRYKVKIRKEFSGLYKSKLAIFLSQASFYSIVPAVYFLFPENMAGQFALVFYVVSLPASFNQLFLNRVLYSNNSILDRYGKFIFLLIAIVAFFESLVIFVISSHDDLSQYIPYGVYIPFFCLFLYLLSRLSYTYTFITNRKKGAHGIDVNIAEFIRLFVQLCSISLAAFFDLGYIHILYLIAISLLLAAVCNFLISRGFGKEWITRLPFVS